MRRPDPTKDWLTRAILGLVMIAALAVGTWSVYTLLRELLHAPKEIALLGCGMFDGAALFFARLAQRYATSPDSGLAPRVAMLAMICASSWVNWQHAALKQWGTVGSVVLASAPVVAEAAFEMWHRYEHREALRRRGRVAEALPVLGKWAWLTHPRRAHQVVDAHITARLATVEAAASGGDTDRITVMRADDAAPQQDAQQAAPQPQHVVIEVRQPAAIETAPAAPRPVEAPHAAEPAASPEPPPAPEAPREAPQPAPAAEPEPSTELALVDPEQDIAGMSKTAAVLHAKQARPGATAPDIVRLLSGYGITVTDGYVRTVLSRAKKAAERDQGPGQGFYP